MNTSVDVRGQLGHAVMVGACVVLLACEHGVAADSGTDVTLSVADGTFFRGSMPELAQGPTVLSLSLGRTSFVAGYQGKAFTGVLAEGAVAVAIALEGDPGYFTLDSGPPAPENRTAPTFQASLSFASTIPKGPHRLQVWALNADGNAGEPMFTDFTVLAVEAPAGTPAFQLTWDTDADLDLSVTDPAGNVISYANPSSATTTANGVVGGDTAGVLDHDSNKNCVLDGLRSETVSFAGVAPSGHYYVYVTPTSLCDTTAVSFRVTAYVARDVVGSTMGTYWATDEATVQAQSGKTLVLDVAMP